MPDQFDDAATPFDPELASTAKLRQPPGLWCLFVTEMWERFSYYGMRAILVLYLIAGTADVFENGIPNHNPGFGWTEQNAYLLYGVYTFMVYLTAIFGGVIADRFLGTHRSMLAGGWIIAAGHITLAGTELFGITPGKVVTMQTSPGSLICFMIGLALIIVGTGFFKPCVSVMVGQLYKTNDPRRDSGFTIFYMGINLGAFFSPLVAGTLGEKVGWHWGFGSAAVGMIAGLFFYQFVRPKYLAGIGDPPSHEEGSRPSMLAFLTIAGGIVAVPVVPLVLWIGGGLAPIVELWGSLTATNAGQVTAWVVGGALIIGAILAFVLAQPGPERAPLGVIFVLAFVGNIPFWVAFEQAGSSMNVFAKNSTDRTVWGLLEGDDLVQYIRLGDDLEPGSRFALRLDGSTTGDVVLGTTSADDVGALVRELDAFADMTIDVTAANDEETTTPIAAGHVVTLKMRDAKSRWPRADDVEAAAPLLAIVPPATGSDASGGVSSAIIPDEGFPASWYQSINPLCILLFAPVFAWLWIFLDRRKLNPSTPMKFSLGLWLLGLAFISMVFGAIDAREGLAAPHWLLITYVVYTWGELCLSPVGLSMVTKLAPARLQSFMMGVWFFTFALSNLLAGLVARFSTRVESGEITFMFEGLPGFFAMLVVIPLAVGVVVAILSPILKRMMHGIQ